MNNTVRVDILNSDQTLQDWTTDRLLVKGKYESIKGRQIFLNVPKTIEVFYDRAVASSIYQKNREPLDIPARLDRFRGMQDGWLDGEGIAPDPKGLDWLTDRFKHHFPKDMPLPHLYPTERGGVQAEWSMGDQEISLEVDLRTHTGKWHRADLDSSASDDYDMWDINLDNVSDWNRFSDELRLYRDRAT